MKVLHKYKNGNYDVYLFEDGTKIRHTKDNFYRPDFAENIDIKITNKCTGTNCSYCHEGSSPCGKHGDILNLKFWDTLHQGQEVALGGGNVLEHPDFISLLYKLRDLKVIANITVNQIHFIKHRCIQIRLSNIFSNCSKPFTLHNASNAFSSSRMVTILSKKWLYKEVSSLRRQSMNTRRIFSLFFTSPQATPSFRAKE